MGMSNDNEEIQQSKQIYGEVLIIPVSVRRSKA